MKMLPLPCTVDLFFVFVFISISASSHGQTVDINPIVLSSSPQARGYDVILQTDYTITLLPNNPVALYWSYNETRILEIFTRGPDISDNTCLIANCTRFLVTVNLTSWPRVSLTLTVNNLQDDDDGVDILLFYSTQSQQRTTLNIADCLFPEGGNGTVVIKSEEECDFDCSIRYECAEGFVTDNVANISSVCLANATFYPPPSPVICEPVRCEVNMEDLNDTLLNCSMESVTFGKNETCDCTNGYNGAGIISCLPNEDIMTSDDQCFPVQCLVSLTSEEVIFIGENVTTVIYGKPQNYSCAEGYVGDGAFFKCYANMTTEKSVSCIRATCPVNMTEITITSKLKDCNVTSVSFGKSENCSCADGYNGAGIIFNCSLNGIAESSEIICSEVAIYKPSPGIIAVAVIFGGGGGIVLILGGGLLLKKKCFDKKPSPSPSPVRFPPESPKTTSPLKNEAADT